MHIFFALLVIFLALVNGFTDAPSSIAGCVCTRSLSPKSAIALAAVCNFLGAIIMALISPGVARATFGIANFGSDSYSAILSLCAALASVIIWASVASVFGLPTSESHALVSALSGAAFATNASLSALGGEEWIAVLIGLGLSTLPVIGLSYIIYKLALRIFCSQDRRGSMRYFRKMQFISAGSSAFLHGAQDSQKFIGVYLLGLSFLGGYSPNEDFDIPLYVTLTCAAAMTLGTLLGGSRIIKKVGCEMTHLDPLSSAAADMASSTFLGVCSALGLPTATTHAKTCAIMGVGLSKNVKTSPRAAFEIFLGWLLTFPVCAIFGFILSLISHFIFI